MRLFLLLYNDYVREWYFHGVFDNNTEGKSAIDSIISNGAGYKVIEGKILYEARPQDEEDTWQL